MKEFEMSQQDLEELYEACKAVPLIALNCGIPPTPQEMANKAWEKLGIKMGFDYMSVKPSNKGDRFFTAIPMEGK